MSTVVYELFTHDLHSRLTESMAVDTLPEYLQVV